MMRIESGPLDSESSAALATWIEEFEPLDFEAGRRAKAWLKSNLDLGALPLHCYFVFNDRDEDEPFGFMALGELEVEVAPYDLPIMQVRGTISASRGERHLATKLAWIARGRVGPAGLGSNHSTRRQQSVCGFAITTYGSPLPAERAGRPFGVRLAKPTNPSARRSFWVVTKRA